MNGASNQSRSGIVGTTGIADDLLPVYHTGFCGAMSNLDEQSNFLESIASRFVLILMAALKDSVGSTVEVKIGAGLGIPGQPTRIQGLAGMVQNNIGEYWVVSLGHRAIRISVRTGHSLAKPRWA